MSSKLVEVKVARDHALHLGMPPSTPTPTAASVPGGRSRRRDRPLASCPNRACRFLASWAGNGFARQGERRLGVRVFFAGSWSTVTEEEALTVSTFPSARHSSPVFGFPSGPHSQPTPSESRSRKCGSDSSTATAPLRSAQSLSGMPGPASRIGVQVVAVARLDHTHTNKPSCENQDHADDAYSGLTPHTWLVVSARDLFQEIDRHLNRNGENDECGASTEKRVGGHADYIGKSDPKLHRATLPSVDRSPQQYCPALRSPVSPRRQVAAQACDDSSAATRSMQTFTGISRGGHASPSHPAHPAHWLGTSGIAVTLVALEAISAPPCDECDACDGPVAEGEANAAQASTSCSRRYPFAVFPSSSLTVRGRIP